MAIHNYKSSDAQNLFRKAHKASPFMTLDSGPNEISIKMKFSNINDGQEVYSAMVNFFAPQHAPESKGSDLPVFYAIRNKEGQYYNPKGRRSFKREIWLDSLKKAKIYFSPGPARSQITFLASKWPQFEVPELVELHVWDVLAIKEEERVRKSQNQKTKQVALRVKKDAEEAKKQAERQLEEVLKTLENLKKNSKVSV